MNQTELENLIKSLSNTIEKQDSLIEEMDKKIQQLEKDISSNKDLLEKHKHSGKETYDISRILSDRLGIKISTITGASEAVSIDIMGVVKSQGRAATGITKIFDLFGNSFGIEWSGGGTPFFTTDTEFVIPSFTSNPTAVNGSIYYNTASHKLKVCENGSWKTITTS